MAWDNFLPLFGTAGQMIHGISTAQQADKALEALNKEKYPEYLSPEAIEAKARSMGALGYSAAEIAAFKQNLSRSQNTSFVKQMNTAPGLSQQILAGQNYTNVNAMSNFAANDAQLQRQNLERFRQLIRGQDVLNTGVQLDKRIRTEQALGAQKQAGVKNAFSAAREIKNTFADIFKGFTGGGIGGGGNRSGDTSFQTPDYDLGNTSDYGDIPTNYNNYGNFGDYA